MSERQPVSVLDRGSSRRLNILSPRRRQVVLLSTFTNKEIGGELGISEQHVKNTLSEAYAILRTNNRIQAIVRAIRLGEITLEEVPLPGNTDKIEAVRQIWPPAR